MSISKNFFKRVFLISGFISAVLGFDFPRPVLAEPSVYPTGVTRHDPAKAWEGYVIFGGADGKTHLIDPNGVEVHHWDQAGAPSFFIDPTLVHGKKGHILVQLSSLPEGKDPKTGTSLNPGQRLLHGNQTVGELDWDGKTVWEWGKQAPGGAARQHHDLRRLPNGNTILLVNLIHSVAGFKADPLFDDGIYEVNPGGKIVWKWLASDHLAEFGFTDQELQLLKDSAQADYLHLNDLSVLGPNRWAKAGDKRFDPNNLIINSREASFVAIIDKATGKVVWHLGPDLPFSRDAKSVVPRPVDQISGEHDAHLIPEGLPGAGNLLLFDNQGGSGYPPKALAVQPSSRVLEIDPTTNNIVWEYTASKSGAPNWTFYSPFISSARRLPNGNTLIDEGSDGRFFQVTPEGEIVWEYVSPYFAPAPFGGPGTPVTSNYVYRAQPVPYEWVPEGTPHSETALEKPELSDFKVPQGNKP